MLYVKMLHTKHLIVCRNPILYIFGYNSNEPQPIQTKYGTHAQSRSNNVHKILGAIANRQVGANRSRVSFCPVYNVQLWQLPNNYFHQIWPQHVKWHSVEDFPKKFLKIFCLAGHFSQKPANRNGSNRYLPLTCLQPRWHTAKPILVTLSEFRPT